MAWLNATELTPLVGTATEGEDQRPGGDIPQVAAAVEVADGQDLAVGAERDRIRAEAVGVGERCSLAAGGDIPQVGAATGISRRPGSCQSRLNASEYAFALPKVLVQPVAAIFQRQTR